MKKSITQEAPYGCGIACFASIANITYKQAVEFLGPEQAKSDRFIVKHFREEPNRYGLNYISRHVKSDQIAEPKEGMIALLRPIEAVSCRTLSCLLRWYVDGPIYQSCG